VDRARTKLQFYLENNGFSQAAAARAIGLAPSTCSQWLSGTYDGDDERVARDVMDWLRRERERQGRPSVGEQEVVQTSVYSRIETVLKMAHRERDVAVVVGEAGLGKTLALEKYEEAHPSSTVRVEVGPEYTAKSVAIALCQALDLDASGTMYALMQRVYDRLTGTDTLMIVDQAEILPTRGLELCRRVHDVAEVGVVLAGMPRLRAHLQGSEAKLKQLWSRVGFMRRVDALTDEDLAKLVALYAPDAAPGVEAAVAEVTRNTRVATKLLKRTRHLVDINDVDVVTETVIERAKQMLVVPKVG
jgi:DNA transposition AAA+ family ATPase